MLRLAGFLVPVAWSCFPAAASCQVVSGEPSPQITVSVYDYTALPSETLDKAQLEASKIFRKAGINLFWTPVACANRETGKFRATDFGGGSPTLVIKIVTESMASRLHPRITELGLSAGTQAWIFADRVKTASAFRDYFVVLGDVFAHELGHLLLGPGHSPDGIMRKAFGNDTLLRGEFGSLKFTPEQAGHMRAALGERRLLARTPVNQRSPHLSFSRNTSKKSIRGGRIN